MNSEFNPGFLGMACSHGFWRSAGERAAQGCGRSPMTSSKVRSPNRRYAGRSRVKSRSSRSRASPGPKNAAFQKEKAGASVAPASAI